LLETANVEHEQAASDERAGEGL